MIIANGWIVREKDSGTRIEDGTGYPVAKSPNPDVGAIPCQVIPLSLDLISVSKLDGRRLLDAELKVLMDTLKWDPYLGGYIRHNDRIFLYCTELGINGRYYTVKSVKVLNAVRQVELII